jgi:membrane-bound serine protease (ClpP class)
MLWLGIVLIVAAVALVTGEFFTGSGLMLLLGLFSLIVGLIFLFTGSTLFVDINWYLVIPLIIVLLALVAFIIWRILTTYHHKVATGKEDLVGTTVKVYQTLDPEGTVIVEGEHWNAISESGRIEAGESVVIEKVVGLNLYVAKSHPAA